MSAAHTRLSQISTRWDQVWAAQAIDRRTAAAHARWEILRRYGGAAGRYLLGTVKDADLAADLAQEFAVAFLEGGVSKADPEKGRFRDYLKGVLRNITRDHIRKARRRPTAVGGDGMPEPAVEPDLDAELDRAFRDCWRDELLAGAWLGLEQLERQSGQPYHTLLRLRADRPDLSSEHLAAEMSRQLDREIAAPACRKALQRAREKFAGVLLDEVRGSLSDPNPDAVRDELMELGLYECCRPVLERSDPN